MESKRLDQIVVWGVVALAGVVLLLITTRHNIGTSPDSIVYIGSAQNLLEGRGLSIPYGDEVDLPLIHHAPFYPVLLAAISFLGLDVLTAARGLNGLLFAANIMLVGLLVYSLTRQTRWLPLAGGLLILTSLTMLNIHVYAWSEPLFILLAFSGFWLLAVYWLHGRYFILILSAILIGLAVLTRYAGLALVATGGLGILLFSPFHWRRRLLDVTVFGGISLAPFVLWTVRNQLLAETVSGGREVAFHPIGLSHIWQAIYTLTGWLYMPDNVPGVLRVLVVLGMLAGLAALGWWSAKSAKTDIALPGLLKLLLLFILVYPAFLAFSISFFDANTPFDDRILSPLYVAGVVLVIITIAELHRWVQRPWLTAVLIFVGLLFVGTAVWREVRWVQANAQGLGFSDNTWKQSPLLAEVRQLPDDTPLFSNVPEVIYLHTGKSVLSLPRQFNSVSQTINSDYASDLAAVQQQLAQNGGVIVFFRTLRPQAEQVVNDLEADFPLTALVQTSDGIIFMATSEEYTR